MNLFNILKKTIIALIFILLFGEAYGITLIGTSYRYIFSGICIIALIIYNYSFLPYLELKKKDKFPLQYTIISYILIAVSYPFWGDTHNIYSYIGISVAFLVYSIDFNTANKIIRFIAVLSLFLASYEYLSQHYLFINKVGGITFSEKFLGGEMGVFRAKGLFYGPTLLGMFMVVAALLNNTKIHYFIIGIIVCFLSNSRTGIVLLFPPLLYLIFKKGYSRHLFFIIIILIISSFFIEQINPQITTSITRISKLAEEGSQTSRIFFWIEGLKTYISYPLPNLLIGNNGYFNSIYKNNPESGWICLLTDNGIIGLMFYLLPLLYCLHIFIRLKEYYYILITIIFILFNTIITAHLSGTGNLLYWLMVFELYNNAKSLKYKTEQIAPNR